MKRIFLRFPFALAGLLICSAGNAQAQWRVSDAYDQWGEKNEGKQLAVSEAARSVNGMGKRVYLQVAKVADECISSVYMADETPINLFLVSGDRDDLLNIPIKVNGIEQMAFTSMAFTSSDHFILLFSGSKDDLPSDRYGNYSESKFIARMEQVSKWMAQASTFKIILSTREYGRLIYEFDMTGAREAIQTVCPDLK